MNKQYKQDVPTLHARQEDHHMRQNYLFTSYVLYLLVTLMLLALTIYLTNQESTSLFSKSIQYIALIILVTPLLSF